MWTPQQTRQHEKAAWLLAKMKDNTFSYIKSRPSCSEYEVQQYVVALFKEYKLKSAVSDPIVAFGISTSNFHYAAPQKSSRTLKPNTLIMLDVWARLNEPRAPFADITWMAFYGNKVPEKIQSVFSTVIKARDISITLLQQSLQKKKLPTGATIEKAAMKTLQQDGYTIRKEIRHTTGHALGTTSPHGRYSGIYFKNKNPLKKNLGYTIEPGLYIGRQFGVRSEIDFYITSDDKLVITTPVQKRLHLL